jgi:hypothetical protein
VILPLLGGAILLLLLADVFLTVFHPQGRGGPLTHWQNRAVWTSFRRLGRRADSWLSFAAPAMAVLTVLVWVVLLVGAFALIVYPWIGSFLVSPGSLRVRWIEALYYSGYTAATLGFGDLVPDAEPLRLLAPIEAFLGFAILSASITYLSSVFRELVSMHTLAVNISGYFNAAAETTLESAGDSQRQAFARWAEGVNTSLLHALQAHFQYPILHYFRPTDEERALPPQLEHLLAVRRQLRGDDGAASAGLRDHPSVRSLVGSVERYLKTVEEYFIPEDFAVDQRTGAEDERNGRTAG